MHRHEWKYELFIPYKIQENKQRLRHKIPGTKKFYHNCQYYHISLSNKTFQGHLSPSTIWLKYKGHCLHFQRVNIEIKTNEL
jgi:hypothetical protein